MNKRKMKKLLTVLFISALSFSAFAQNVNDYAEVVRSVISTEKKVLITEVMQLSDSESTDFWALYNEYQEKLYKVGTKRVQLIKDFAENFDNMSGDKAKEVMLTANAIDGEYLKLQKSYTKKFLKILPAQKVLRYFQAENKIKLLIDSEISSEIPLLNDL